MFRSYPINDRIDAGIQISLNEKIKEYSQRDDTLILALPRGGIPVAYQISQKLKIPFDMIFIRKLGLPSNNLMIIKVELERRDKEYRGDKPFPEIKNKNIILVDDGIASGASMKAVGPPEIINELKLFVDDVICIHQPSPFHAVGLWYRQFPQVRDEEVHEYINLSNNINHENENENHLN
ncbi:PRTase-like protein [Neocallimastix californiae]|uniref:PRTase-like protein n=1 Tax=Neocallimastix californiae TaxID=1754190 RepID=A0A1Y2D6M6_9FUNG|nr:PRTase-like protein [Neocallimastix californiae]|eukprot:ORY54930.1 PRTase-like protein [Neocallimastix californiae]